MIQPQSTTVPLTELHVSPLNARYGVEQNEIEIAALADSIAAVGLIHPLVVHEDPAGGYAVIAGARRLAAIQWLDEHGDWQGDGVPVMIHDNDANRLAQASVAENLQRAPMTDAELLSAVKQLLARAPSRPTDEMLAQAFGTSERRIQRLVRLSHVAQPILDEYFSGELERRELEAFARTPDQDKQLELWELYRNDGIGLWDIGKLLGFDDHEHTGWLAWVGADTFEAAGGLIERDLFNDQDSWRIVNPDLLEQLVREKMLGVEAELRKTYPDKGFMLGLEAPLGSDGYRDHNLRCHPRYPAEVQAQLDALDNQIDEKFSAIGELIGKRIYPYSYESMLESSAADLKLKGKTASAYTKLIDEARALADQQAEVEQSPKEIPDGACLAVLEIQRDGYSSISWWFPDRAAAGQTGAGPTGKPDDKPTPPKPGDDDYDPDAPELTQRATDYVKAMRVRTAGRFLTDQANETSRAAARRAHRALIFTMAYKQATTSYLGAEQTGLVHSFDGDRYGFTNSPLSYIEPPKVAGLMHKDVVAGWRAFDKAATDDDVQLLAAWVFAAKLQPEAEANPKSVAGDVLKVLADEDHARRYVQPDLGLEFFKLFSKKVLAAFGTTVTTALGAEIANAKGEEPAKISHVNLGEKAKVGSAAWAWLPTFLRWS